MPRPPEGRGSGGLMPRPPAQTVSVHCGSRAGDSRRRRGRGGGPVGRDHRGDRGGDGVRRVPRAAADPPGPAPVRGRHPPAGPQQHGLHLRGDHPDRGRGGARPRLPGGVPAARLGHLRRLGGPARPRPGRPGRAPAAGLRHAQPQRARLRRAHPRRPAGRLGGLRHLGRHRPPSLSTLHLLREQIAANRRAYQVTVAIVVVGLALFGLVVTLALGLGVSGLGAGLGLAVLVVALAPGLGERAALRDAGAEPADPDRWPRYHNLVDGLRQAAGLPAPRLYVTDGEAANAFSVGRDPSEAALVVTRGLLTTLNRVELEGVLAHELNHIWSWGARLATLGVALGRVPGLLRLLAPPRREFDA